MNYANLNKLSGGIKHMYKAGNDHKITLVVTNELKNYLIKFPMIEEPHEIGEALINFVFCKHELQSYLTFDDNKEYSSIVM